MAMEQDSLTAFLSANTILSKLVATTARVFPQITTTQTTVGAAGAASALPATPKGYLNVTLPTGESVVMPYYNP